MGRLTLELMKHTAPGSFGMFRLMSLPAARAAGFPDFKAYAESLVKSDPLSLEGEPVPRIRQGTVLLNDPTQAEAYLAIFQVAGMALVFEAP